ncbi:MAG: type II toxin-antitoxin system RelE/ParE family toxin [Chiayiivirga sp.]|jgi:phage-related protein|uniref:type II toxin-antitoxin system RelE/ParE family toxin n=1 Tax=Chiayiivirga sp. TaxID=2041042 RepID=UPI0025B7EFB3|nr:type II toxin-antitoxin system RelE/ParE family toxin [Chiayiivirga sp.]MCI1710136.1 type II toxin-antitoxin system RelE/ParE family toxin [Chiayiivirga sp.]MCI1729067.1 type II toxin-antitoxin system RelE/ParE family toxin [Chiayiivirga sp.]
MKPVRFSGTALDDLRAFPESARHDAGYQLHLVQCGEAPDDFKPMPEIGRGVEEIRLRDESGAFRVIYTARLADAIHVLHAFQKKTQRTARADIELARSRYTKLLQDRR